MSDHSEDTDDIKPTISTSDDCMDSDAMKDINFLLASSRIMKIEETPVFNIRLIAEVKSRPFLYDQSDEGYNLISWRNSAWNEIAEALETTPEHVKTRWKTLRDRYKKEEKKERVSKKSSSWVFQRPLRFIQAHLKDRHTDDSDTSALDLKSEGNISPMEATMNFIESELIRNHEQTSTSSSLEDSSAGSSASNGNTNQSDPAAVATPPPITIPIAVTPSPSAASSKVYVPPTKRARNSIAEGSRNAGATATSLTGLSLIQGLAGQWSSNRVAEDEEDEIFGRMIALKLSRLDPRTKELAKMQVLKAIFDAQYGS